MADEPKVTGLVSLSGFPDVGKSSFALECGAAPERMMFVDSDIKTRNVVRQLQANGVKLGRYVPWIEETKGMKEVQMFEYGMRLVDSIKPGQYDALIYDTITEWENCFKPAVSLNPKRYRDNYSPQGQIKGAEEWQASFDLEAEVIDTMLSKVPLVIFVAHLKAYNISGKRVEGKWVAAVKQPVITKSSLRLWLMRNPDGRPVPYALVLKRLDHKIVVNNRIRTVNVLPLKLMPRQDDASLWDTINYYVDNPIGNQIGGATEQLSEWEMSVIENTLTIDQKMAMRLALAEAEQEAAETQAMLTGRQGNSKSETELKAEIVALASAGKSNDEIRLALGNTVSVPMIIAARRSMQYEDQPTD